ncbi:MAG: hypothetical protein DRP09_12115 [Candidatus Thorarchaeota archaeon]|nr:MAG: hypothetical protein DRP09_12115 [Candidatus Thorarchaeota archaeon]
MPKDLNRPNRGDRKTASHSFASGTGVTTSGTAVLTGATDHVYIARRIYFQYPDDVTAWDMSLKIDGIRQEGTAYEVFRIDDAGTNGPTDLRAVFDIDIPNPPSGMIYGYVDLSNVALAAGDTITIVGNDATAANNYTSTGATAMQVTVIYEDMPAGAYVHS